VEASFSAIIRLKPTMSAAMIAASLRSINGFPVQGPGRNWHCGHSTRRRLKFKPSNPHAVINTAHLCVNIETRPAARRRRHSAHMADPEFPCGYGRAQFRRRKLQGRGAGILKHLRHPRRRGRIHGRLDVLERLVMSGAAAAAVPSFVRKWRPSVDETDNYVSAGAL
jgi:hypothetical protein